MAFEKEVKNLKGLKSEPETKSAEKGVSSLKGLQSSLVTSSRNFTSSSGASSSGVKKGVAGQGSRSCTTRFYQYPGAFSQPTENGRSRGDGSEKGTESTASYVYYLPGYNLYAAGPAPLFEGQPVYFSSLGYSQQVPYGFEALPCYAWGSRYFGNMLNGYVSGPGKPQPGRPAVAESIGSSSLKTDTVDRNKRPMLAHSQRVRSPSKGFDAAGKPPSSANQGKGFLPRNGSMNYGSSDWVQNRKDGPSKQDKNEDFDASAEITRGPRGKGKLLPSDSMAKKEVSLFGLDKGMYNLPDFKTEYERAKFYVIKSYSEDDVHQSLKYNVWSSTPYGNKKLDAAFRNANPNSNLAGNNCPIFLFFSVNASGQFVGVAEMMGPVDFKKDMSFWRLDKWVGFFPVQWHIIKDIPNRALHHIIIDVEENRPVTYTRDTHQIGLDNGLEMLKIFKNYPAKTSLLDDFSFYENREKPPKPEKKNKPATLRIDMERASNYDDEDTMAPKMKNKSAGWSPRTNVPGTLMNMTRNLSINGCSSRGNGNRTRN